MRNALRAGVAYYAAVFAVGFVLGPFRILWIAPALGETTAVLAELPVMLVLSWIVAGRVLQRYAVRESGAALVMGATAFALLMASEWLLASVMFGQPARAWLSSLLVVPGVFGLSGQVAFATLPALRVLITKQARG